MCLIWPAGHSSKKYRYHLKYRAKSLPLPATTVTDFVWTLNTVPIPLPVQTAPPVYRTANFQGKMPLWLSSRFTACRGCFIFRELLWLHCMVRRNGLIWGYGLEDLNKCINKLIYYAISLPLRWRWVDQPYRSSTASKFCYAWSSGVGSQTRVTYSGTNLD